MRKRHIPFYKLKKKAVGILLIVFALVLIFLLLKADNAMRSITDGYAENEAITVANKVIGETVSEYLGKTGIKYDDISKIGTDESGNISSIVLDTVALSKMKARIVTDIESKIKNSDMLTLSVPVGTLTGNRYLNGRGPEIKIKMQLSSAVFTEMKSEFSSSGINQTLHKVSLLIKTKVYFVMPWYRSSGNYENEFLIAEAVIVGKVPEAYTNVIEDEDDMTAGYINDYGASVK